MASNVADIWLLFGVAGTDAASGVNGWGTNSIVPEIDLTATGLNGIYIIPSRCQVKEWGLVVTTTFVAFTVKPIVRLERRPLVTGTAVVIESLTLGATNTTLRKYTSNPDVVAAGGPGTVTVGPAIGGNTSAASADTAFTAGTVILGDTKALPSVVLQPGDALQLNVQTAGTVGSGKVIGFARLEVAGEQYTTAFVQYDAIP